MVEDRETKEHFVRLTLTKPDSETPQIFDVQIPTERVEDLYNAEIEFDIIRRVTLIEERSISELTKKEK
jgi:hypothetical protein